MKLTRYIFYFRRFGMSGVHYLRAIETGREVRVKLEGLTEILSIQTQGEINAFHEIFAKNPKYKKLMIVNK